MKVKVTAVYANLPLPTTEPVELTLSDHITSFHIIDIYRKYQNGDIQSPFIKITIKDSDMPDIRTPRHPDRRTHALCPRDHSREPSGIIRINPKGDHRH